METDFIGKILQLYRANCWREILDCNRNSDNLIARKLLWVWPEEINLNFIKINLISFNKTGIISIGCGCGLLEWILIQYLHLPVVGYEINREWWSSRYSNPQFIDLYFPKLPFDETLNPNYALMFCYFNNGDSFRDYIQHYGGDLVFIIGPGSGAGRYTDPQPFRVDFGNTDWLLYDYQEIKNTKDFIGVYIKQ